MLTILNCLFKDETGATAIEYGLIAALVSVAAIAALHAVGGGLVGTFTNVAAQLYLPARV